MSQGNEYEEDKTQCLIDCANEIDRLRAEREEIRVQYELTISQLEAQCKELKMQIALVRELIK